MGGGDRLLDVDLGVSVRRCVMFIGDSSAGVDSAWWHLLLRALLLGARPRRRSGTGRDCAMFTQ